MKLLIAGLGSIGRRHLGNLRTLLPSERIVVLRRPESAVGARPPEADRVVTSVDDALAEGPDAAILCGPATSHVMLGEVLAAEGVHVLVEKPLAASLDGVERWLETVHRRGTVLMVGYTLRFHAPLRVLREAVAGGLVGRPVSLRAEAGQYLPTWRPGTDYRTSVSARSDLGGGVVLELSHELDYARWILGEVAAVSARLCRVSDLDIDVEDLAEITLEFQDGAVGSVHLDMVRRPAGRACRVLGMEGTVEWDSESQGVRLFNGNTGRWEQIGRPPPVDGNAMYVEELRHFLECVRTGSAPMISGEDGMRVLQIALAAKESSSSGRRMVL